jgi:type II secretory ATPase GspE/PulE/Tfp pilus assembly ATPase PilB-like protein
VELILNQRLVRRLCQECGGKGCGSCLHTGYRGRLPLVEWLRVNEPFRRGISARDFSGLAAHTSLREAAQELLKSGQTNEAELVRVLGVHWQ